MNKNKRNSINFYLVILLLSSAILAACGGMGGGNNAINNGGGGGSGGGGADIPVDSDNDGIADALDNCPLVANADQADFDEDGSGNVCDADADGDNTSAMFDTNDLDATDMGGDHDGDSIMGINDVDDDGDGLIEILNVLALNSIRYNLNGTGLDLTNTDTDNEAGGSSMGCGNGTRAGIDITACNGYELMQDIDLNDLIGTTAPDGRMYRAANNWERIGSCAIGPLAGGNTGLESRLCDISSSATEQFSAIFEGNDMTIRNLAMHIDNNTMNTGLAAGDSARNMFEELLSSSVNNAYSGVSFFGAFSSASVVRNLRMENSRISADTGIRIYNLGGLVGYGQGANIANSAVELSSVSGVQYIGGLVGYGQSATINSSSSIVDTIEGAGEYIGGLVGWGQSATISSSSAIVDIIRGDEFMGGLVGNGQSAIISSSSAIVDIIEGAASIGGLLGFGFIATISSSSAIVDTIRGNDDNIGGLIGSGGVATISNSLALSREIDGSGAVHQLTGGSTDPLSVTNSSWQDGVMATGTAPDSAFLSSDVRGTGRTASDLQSPTSFTGIYENWDNAWCDPATGGFTADSNSPLAIDANRVWDLGNGSEYPVISSACFGDRLTPQLQRNLIGRVLGGTDLFPLP